MPFKAMPLPPESAAPEARPPGPAGRSQTPWRWPERCGWVAEHPEEAAHLLHTADQHLERERGVRHDLEDLGIFLSMEDGRINVPDVFRVGYGLGRRGGVKPVHSTSAE